MHPNELKLCSFNVNNLIINTIQLHPLKSSGFSTVLQEGGKIRSANTGFKDLMVICLKLQIDFSIHLMWWVWTECSRTDEVKEYMFLNRSGKPKPNWSKLRILFKYPNWNTSIFQLHSQFKPDFTWVTLAKTTTIDCMSFPQLPEYVLQRKELCSQNQTKRDLCK